MVAPAVGDEDVRLAIPSRVFAWARARIDTHMSTAVATTTITIAATNPISFISHPHAAST